MASGGGGGGISLPSPIPFPEKEPITVFINGVSVRVVGETPLITHGIIGACVSSLKFRNWAEHVDPEFTVTRIVIQSVDMFGPNVGFIKVKADATIKAVDKKDGVLKDMPIPSIVFIRGASVAILVILMCEGKRWIIWTKQPRFAVGSRYCVELPAGMLDENGNFAGVAAKELSEETGIKITTSMLNHLGNIYPSPGGCDEMIGLFCYTQEVSPKELADFQGKCTGVEGEIITLEIMPYEGVEHSTEPLDAKALCAVLLYERKEAEKAAKAAAAV